VEHTLAAIEALEEVTALRSGVAQAGRV
jgi:hypothetical protein